MGYLHNGHLSLIECSRKENDITIVSIFVNPTQFSPTEDLSKYPRDLIRDNKLLEQAGVDLLFLPSNEEIYGSNFQTYVNVEKVTKILEGESRPHHFRGVSTVVNILFNIVQPQNAYFGQKDAQQLAVIKRMVNDLHLPVKIIGCPIIREQDGLAMSSRNVYLSKKERVDALALSRSIFNAKSMIESGETKAEKIISESIKEIKSLSSANLDYLRIVESTTFEEVLEIKKGNQYIVLVACKIGKTRLIDNCEVNI